VKVENNDKIISFESALPVINFELKKRAHKWQLHAIVWMDWKDVEQLIRIHIWKKFHLYDPSQPLSHWVNAIISNQITNIRRNLYDAYSRPCLKCSCAEGLDLCSVYSTQSSACPLYAKWEKTKKRAHDVKLAVSAENHIGEVFNIPGETIDYAKAGERLHEEILKILAGNERKIYTYLYIDNLSEEETARKLGYKSNEKNSNRKPGYATIIKFKKLIMIKVRKVIEEIDLF
jgi:DNA-directed RNA polymerase specialized sigma24 family protein